MQKFLLLIHRIKCIYYYNHVINLLALTAIKHGGDSKIIEGVTIDELILRMEKSFKKGILVEKNYRELREIAKILKATKDDLKPKI